MTALLFNDPDYFPFGFPLKVLGIDSPVFSTIVLFKVSAGSRRFSERRILERIGKVLPRKLQSTPHTWLPFAAANMSSSPLLVLKGLCHYWTYFLIFARGRRSKWK